MSNQILKQCKCDGFFEPTVGCACKNAEVMALNEAFALLVETPERLALKRVRHQLASHPDDWGRLIAGIDEVLG